MARPTVSWGLLSLLVAQGSYYALLFTLAQYLQGGLGRGELGVAVFGRALASRG